MNGFGRPWFDNGVIPFFLDRGVAELKSLEHSSEGSVFGVPVLNFAS